MSKIDVTEIRKEAQQTVALCDEIERLRGVVCRLIDRLSEDQLDRMLAELKEEERRGQGS